MVFTVRGDRVQTIQMLDKDKPVIIIDERRSRSSTSSVQGSLITEVIWHFLFMCPISFGAYDMDHMLWAK